jgi:hypothetical protein
MPIASGYGAGVTRWPLDGRFIPRQLARLAGGHDAGRDVATTKLDLFPEPEAADYGPPRRRRRTSRAPVEPARLDPELVPPLPERDNDPGAPDVLLCANAWWRKRPWPPPFDRTAHRLVLGDARDLGHIADASVHLIVTSPPYFNLKPYHSDANGSQLGRIDDYEAFLVELDKIWAECFRVLVPGGRICCVIGDILIPRKRDGRHRILPLSANIMVRSRAIGFDTLTPIL